MQQSQIFGHTHCSHLLLDWWSALLAITDSLKLLQPFLTACVVLLLLPCLLLICSGTAPDPHL